MRFQQGTYPLPSFWPAYMVCMQISLFRTASPASMRSPRLCHCQRRLPHHYDCSINSHRWVDQLGLIQILISCFPTYLFSTSSELPHQTHSCCCKGYIFAGDCPLTTLPIDCFLCSCLCCSSMRVIVRHCICYPRNLLQTC
ncbi:hypothetical protein BDR03DRAFT_961042 [Suillus americanus]|nr:hypothetical protein BDR03DRAFT_961042 [Suillus americanus]